MSKGYSSKDKLIQTRVRKLRALLSISIVLSLVMTAFALANLGDSRETVQGRKDKNRGMTIESFAAGSPSKEYVYVGSRLISTEEPTLSCSYSLSSTCGFFLQPGGNGTVNVTAPQGCDWTVVNNASSWINITSGSSGSGNGTVTFQVIANSTGSPRQGTLTIAELTYTAIQDAGLLDCVYVISPVFLSHPASGGTGSFNVFTQSRCAWQPITVDADWVTITSMCAGIGDGTVTYSVAPNTTGSGRVGKITTGDQSFTVKQKP